jgi:8-oxo-dGTP pyrophosphatase MutT (NUDIX family)
LASPAQILAAAKAAPGGARPTPPPQGGTWIGQLPSNAIQPGRGYAPGYGPFLPRPAETFTEGAFSPFSPILPVPLDMPPPGAERPQPRRWAYRPGYDLPVGQPGTEGYKLASFETLKSLSELYSILRTCLEIRKKEIQALDWDIVLTKDAAKAYRGDQKAMRDFGERRDKVIKFFKRPDPNYFSFSSWIGGVLDQAFVYDALSLYMCPKKSRGLGKGLLGSDLDSLWLLDGSSIRPLVDLHGAIPAPPAPAFQQYFWGVPRADFTTMIAGLDLTDYGMSEKDLRSELRGDQLLYLPMLQRPDSPYGFSIVERALIPVMTGLQKQAYQLDFFSENSVPSVYISPGDTTMSPTQVRELQDALNAIAGDIAWRFKVIVLPPGSKVMPQKEMQIVDQADEWIANEVAMVCDITPIELGIIPQVSTVASPFAAREMAQASRTIHKRISTKPTLKFFTEIFDMLIQVVGKSDDMRFIFSGMEEQQDQSASTDMLVKQVQSAVSSIDEARDTLGKTPWGLPETSGPVVFTPAGPLPLGDAISAAQANQAGTAGPDGSAPPAGQQPALTPAHAAAQGGSGPAANASGRPGAVTERQRARGGALAPAHATAYGAPGTATGSKAALAELEALTRHLNKGRLISTWVPRNLPGSVIAVMAEDLAKGLTPAQAAVIVTPMLAKGAGALSRWPGRKREAGIIARYAGLIGAALRRLLARIRKLVRKWMRGTVPATAQVLAGMIRAELASALYDVLPGLWLEAWLSGWLSALELTGSTVSAASYRWPEDRAGLESLARELGEAAWLELQQTLGAWGTSVVNLITGTHAGEIAELIAGAARSGMTPDELAAEIGQLIGFTGRAEMITVTEMARARNAAVAAVYAEAGVTEAEWAIGSGNPCGRCVEAAGSGPRPLGDIFPGVGVPFPAAHIRCECFLIPVPPVVKAMRRQVGLNGEVTWADGPALARNPAGGGASSGVTHDQHGIQQEPQRDIPGGVPGPSAGGEPPRWDGSEPHPHDLSLPSSDDGEQGGPGGTGSRPGADWPGPYMDGKWPSGGHGGSQPGTSSPGGATGRPPNSVGKATGRVSAGLPSRPVKPEKVYRQLLANFPPESLKWVLKATWVLAEVPQDMIDYADEDSWAAAHQPGHVAEFGRDYEAGRPVNPPVMVDEPGHMHLIVADGRHRSLARRKTGDPVRAYVGTVTRRGGPWLKMYLQQRHSGSSPANKSFTAGAGAGGSVSGLVPYNLLTSQTAERERFARGVMGRLHAMNAAEGTRAAGLVIQAASTGRVLMIQRAIGDDDKFAGMWEWPGGHIEPGETPLQGALREWAEETGCNVPRGSLSGHWASPNGIYEGFVLTIPDEDAVPIDGGRDQVRNPDGDSFEAVAWFDPEHLRGNLAVRPELRADLDRVMGALGALVPA